jgi:hypothetical protein
LARDVFGDPLDALIDRAKDAAPELALGVARKKRPTMFSPEALVGVKCT